MTLASKNYLRVLHPLPLCLDSLGYLENEKINIEDASKVCACRCLNVIFLTLTSVWKLLSANAPFNLCSDDTWHHHLSLGKVY